MKKDNKKALIIIGIITCVVFLSVGITYAAFNYSRVSGNSKLVLGDIYMHYNETNEMVIEGAMPSSTYDDTKYFEFTIDGKNTYTKKDIYYEVVITHGNTHETKTERLKDELLRFTLKEVNSDGSETVITNDLTLYDLENGARIYVNTIPMNTLTEINKTYRLYMWISDHTVICGGEEVNESCDYYTSMNPNWDNVYASIKVNVNGDFSEKEVKYISDEFRDVLATKLDTLHIEYIEETSGIEPQNNTDNSNIVKHLTNISTSELVADDVYRDDVMIYLSGTNDTVNYNYVWYSDILWRILSIEPDGKLKLVTNTNYTRLPMVSWRSYSYSELRKWLNETFILNLNDSSNYLVTDYGWEIGSFISTSEIDKNEKLYETVGILNSYEFYNSYRRVTSETGYLNQESNWWLSTYRGDILTPGMLYTDPTGFRVDHWADQRDHIRGVRPSIVLKANILLKDGNGTIENPYILSGEAASSYEATSE